MSVKFSAVWIPIDFMMCDATKDAKEMFEEKYHPLTSSNSNQLRYETIELLYYTIHQTPAPKRKHTAERSERRKTTAMYPYRARAQRIHSGSIPFDGLQKWLSKLSFATHSLPERPTDHPMPASELVLCNVCILFSHPIRWWYFLYPIARTFSPCTPSLFMCSCWVEHGLFFSFCIRSVCVISVSGVDSHVCEGQCDNNLSKLIIIVLKFSKSGIYFLGQCIGTVLAYPLSINCR